MTIDGRRPAWFGAWQRVRAGAVGALGIILAFNFGGKPNYVMPLVFGGAPVVNTLVTITVARQWGQLNPFYIAGLLLVGMGAVTVLVFKPKPVPKPATEPAAIRRPVEAAGESVAQRGAVERPTRVADADQPAGTGAQSGAAGSGAGPDSAKGEPNPPDTNVAADLPAGTEDDGPGSRGSA